MSRKGKRLLMLLVLLLVLAVTIAGALIGRKASTTLDGVTVAAESAHALSECGVEAFPDRTLVHLGGRQVTVTREGITLPGGVNLAVPAGCRRIDLREEGDSVRVLLDGVPAN